MNRTLRLILVVCGVACFVIAALTAAGWIPEINANAFALLGFAFWLASTAP